MKTKNGPDRRVRCIDAKCKNTPYQMPMSRVYGVVNQLSASAGGNSKGLASQMMVSNRTVKENIVISGTQFDKSMLYQLDHKPLLQETASFEPQFGVTAHAAVASPSQGYSYAPQQVQRAGLRAAWSQHCDSTHRVFNGRVTT